MTAPSLAEPLDIVGTISVVSHGHGPILTDLLNDLDQLPGIEHWRIIVTLNLPTDKLDREAFPRLHILQIHNVVSQGFGRNHNAAFEKCVGRWFVVVNPDIRIVDPKTLSRIASPGNGDEAAIRAPIVRNRRGELEDSVRRNLTPVDLWRRRHDRSSIGLTAANAGTFFWVAGMFMIFNKIAFNALGGFDERYFLYCEDYDICARAALAGFSVRLMEDLTVVHDAQRDSHKSRKYLRWHVESLMKVWTSSVFWRLVLFPVRFLPPSAFSDSTDILSKY